MGYIPYNDMATNKDMQIELEDLKGHLKGHGILDEVKIFIDRSYGKYNLKYTVDGFTGESDISIHNTKRELDKQIAVVNKIFDMLDQFVPDPDEDDYNPDK